MKSINDKGAAMSQSYEEALALVLCEHVRWAASGGKVGVQLDLSYADLRGASLFGANLSRANLAEANLTHAKVKGAYLAGSYVPR